MLTTESPPPDPSETTQLKSNVSGDEKASDNNLHQLEVVDLFKSGLDDNNPLPKFSIRDYVFNTRSKDIKTHWPFSPKNLQLCLKNGVKDVLPPFQTLDSVRNRSSVKCAAENISNSDVKLFGFSYHPLSVPSNNVGKKLALDIENIKSSGSEEDKEYPSATTSQSCSDIISVPVIKSPYLELEAENLPGSSAGEPDFAVPVSNQVESNTQKPVKKCKVIVKLSNIAEPKLTEESSANASVVSETMASKVCPVCKTFSSSSNTTLNAHIDQCLSGESTVKRVSNSKVIKHRIKPRKTRLMVDVYATALHCTLEDLDRRNGTNWALNMGFAVQDLEECTEEKNISDSSVSGHEDNCNEGAVYFDSNGTKLRILSKFSGLPTNSSAKDDCEPTKLVKRDKGSKILSSKKKKYLVQRHKPLEYPPYGQGSCSPRPDHCPKDNNGHEKKFPPEEDEREDLEQPMGACHQTRSDDFGMIKQWVGSKRTGLKKNVNLDGGSRHSDKIIKNLRVKSSNLPSPGVKFSKRTSDLSFANLSDGNPLLSTEIRKRKENSSFNSHDAYKEPPCLRKRVEFPSLESRNCHGMKNHFMLSEWNMKQLKTDEPSAHKGCIDPPIGMESHSSSRSYKKMRSVSPTMNADSSFISSRMSQHRTFSSRGKEFTAPKKTLLDDVISSRGKKLSSLRKKLLSVRHASISESKKNLGRKHLNFKKRRLHYESGSDEEAVVSRSAAHMRYNLAEIPDKNAVQMEKASGKSLTGILKFQKKRGGLVNIGKEGETTPEISDSPPQSDTHGVEKNIDSSVGGNVPGGASNDLDVVKDVEIQDEFVCEPTSKVSGGETFIAVGQSLGSEYSELTGPSDVELVSGHYIKSYEGRSPVDLGLGGEGEMFYANKVGKDLNTANNTLVTAEINPNEGQGNYFVDVDPIPIPGPPGSFLPSPGRMGSEEIQGNSSLTTCRILSSEDEYELVDRDSSDSPISATSFASNSIAARSDSVSFANLSLQSHGVQHESQRDISEDRMDPVLESSFPFELAAAAADGNLKLDESRGNSMLPEMSPRRFKNRQPCCCSRKEGVLRAASLNYQESQLLRRRAITSLPPPPSQEKQMGRDPNGEVYSSNLRSETFAKHDQTPPEKIVTDSPKGCAILPVSQGTEAKFPTCGNSELPSPSTPNPVLRLMGKNLMVVNDDENPSPQMRTTQSCTVNDYPSQQSAVDNVVSSSAIQNEHHCFNHSLSRAPSTFDNKRTHTTAQHFDFSSSDGSRLHANFRTPESCPHPSRVVLSSKCFGGNFTSSFECHEYSCGRSFTPEHLGSKMRLDSPIRYEVKKLRTPVPQPRAADASGGKQKEIIVIDDSPENEVNMEARRPTVGILASRASGNDSGHVNYFYSYQTRCSPLYSGSQMVQNTHFQVQPLKAMEKKSINWNCSPEGSNLRHPNLLPAPLPPTGHQRSLYFAPGFL
ncbi:hypothetical protein Salat_2011000 [Sesamum alatum]|uniref:Uncharacterized protein n=1 Tax=Sesamum alatum TaxID=300844 RepID=A0AAE2CFX4_9LAMI|nr:hypothetical protein Salat_2011000 [Sesamum alatum]